MANQVVTWPSCRKSILHFCWTKGQNIKRIMFHAQSGLQGAKKTAGQGVMSSHGKGLRGGGGQGNRSKVQIQSKNQDQKWPAAMGLWPRGSPEIISAPHGLAISLPPRGAESTGLRGRLGGRPERHPGWTVTEENKTALTGDAATPAPCHLAENVAVGGDVEEEGQV